MKINYLKKSNFKSVKFIHLPKFYGVIAKVLVLLCVFFFLFISIAPWQQTASAIGRVVAFSPTDRQQIIAAPIEGRIKRWYVQEGTKVKTGDPIVEISDIDTDLIARLKFERNAVQMRLETSERAAELSAVNVERQKKLFDEGISSRRQYEQARLEYANFVTEIANNRVELAKLDNRIARQNNQFVKASRPGIIMKRLAGQESVLVKAGETLAEMIPDTSSRVAEVWVDGNDLPLVHLNQSARVQFEGWPAIQFSGWPSVAVGTFPAKVIVIDPAGNASGQFRVILAPPTAGEWPKPSFLRQGIKVQAWILLGQVPLWYELWRRFNNFPPSIQQPNEKNS